MGCLEALRALFSGVPAREVPLGERAVPFHEAMATPLDPPAQAGCAAAMDPLSIAELKLQFLEEQAARADQRIATLAQEALTHRGGGQHLGALNTLVEGHRTRMCEAHATAEEKRITQPQGQERDDAHQAATLAKGTVSGVNDALAYLRAQMRAAEMSAQQAEAGMGEAQLNRRDLATQAQKAVGEVGLMRQQLADGVAREGLGRPLDARGTREEVDRRKQAAQEATPKRAPRERRAHA